MNDIGIVNKKHNGMICYETEASGNMTSMESGDSCGGYIATGMII